MLKARHYRTIKEIKIIGSTKELQMIIDNIQREIVRRSDIEINDYESQDCVQPNSHNYFYGSHIGGGLPLLPPPFYIQ